LSSESFALGGVLKRHFIFGDSSVRMAVQPGCNRFSTAEVVAGASGNAGVALAPHARQRLARADLQHATDLPSHDVFHAFVPANRRGDLGGQRDPGRRCVPYAVRRVRNKMSVLFDQPLKEVAPPPVADGKRPKRKA